MAAGVTAVSLTLGVPTVAQAAPMAGVLAADVADQGPASYEQKLKVAVKFGRGDDAALIERTDRDFVIGLWKLIKDDPDHLEVSAAAELAYGTLSAPEGSDATAAACREFIVTGVFAAFERDLAREKAEADAKRQSDLARAAAAASIHVVADAAMLNGDDRAFAQLIWKRVENDTDWPKVKEAAAAALAGTAEQQRTFIASGLAAAAKQDIADIIAKDQEKSEAEKAAALARAAKESAAHKIGLEPTPQLLNLPDRDFVTEVWNHAAGGSEVQAAAIAAARSNDPAVWKSFIEVGIHQAKDRDTQRAFEAAAAEDRRQVEEILVRAEKIRHRKLAAAARAALAGTRDDVSWFRRTGQFEVGPDALTEDARADIPVVYGYATGAIAPLTFTTGPTGAFTSSKGTKTADGAYNISKIKTFRGDFNGDKIVDQAVLNGAADGSMSLDTFLAKPDGTYQAGLRSWQHKTFGAYDRMRLTSGDFNKDGRTDIAGFLSYPDYSIGLHTWLAREDGGFGNPTRSWFAPAQPYWGEVGRMKIFSGDFNNDGRTDIGSFYGHADHSVAIYTWTANTSGGFGNPTRAWHAPSTPYWGDVKRLTITAGDFNGDGLGDAAGLYGYADGKLAMFTFTAKLGGGFNNALVSWKSTTAAFGSWDRTRLTAGDFNGDGRDDVAFLHGYDNGTVALHSLTADTTGAFAAPVKAYSSATFGSYGSINLADDQT
ncbi:hypothetical protein BG844_14125 [Couchioplanes caeruleus subsp. caeruleus]|uniref:VCBS repeat protein n=2 Tax=Couchioplanes caeruleus TaxID=56438 RepID=A0A1K0FLG6_9ACTN|nr:hypothetical protein BG844_14125 [Couchioplanes caeruleus subsp. caeruleus]